MHVVQICPAYPPDYWWGGTAAYAAGLSRGLDELGHRVSVVCYRFTGDYSADPANGVHRVRPWPAPIEGRTMGLRLAFGAITTLWGIMRAADIIHIHEARYWLAAIAAIEAALLRKPLVVQPHGTIGLGLRRHRLKRLYDAVVGTWLYRRASVLALTEAELREIRGLGARSIDVLGPFVDCSEIEGGPTIERTCEGRHILFAGRLDRKKGLLSAVEMLRLLPDDVHLTIAGRDFGEWSSARNLINERGLASRVHYIGFVERRGLRTLFGSAVMFIAPALFDAAPVILLEAACARLPVVASDTIDLVRDLPIGCVSAVPPRPEALARAVDALLRDEAAATAQATRFAAWLEEHGRPAAIAAHALDIYAHAQAAVSARAHTVDRGR